MIIHNVEQGSDEWFKLRKRRLTCSHATAIAANGAGLKTYIKKKVLGLFIEERRYSNLDIERGNLLEPIARIKYEFETGLDVVEVGFISMNEWVGYSPDGLIGEDGLLEIKARNDEKHYDLLKTGKIDTGTVWQMQMGMLVSKRKWCDFVSYNENFYNSIFINRVERDEDAIRKLIDGISSGVAMLQKAIESPVVVQEIDNKKLDE